MTDYLKQIEALPEEGRSILGRHCVRLADAVWEVNDGFSDRAYLELLNEGVNDTRISIVIREEHQLSGSWRGNRNGAELSVNFKGDDLAELAGLLLTYEPVQTPVWLCDNLWRMTQARWQGRLGGHDFYIERTTSTGSFYWSLEYEPAEAFTGYSSIHGSDSSLELALAAMLAAPLKMRDGARRLLATSAPTDEAAPLHWALVDLLAAIHGPDPVTREHPAVEAAMVAIGARTAPAEGSAA
jgi:hypothetical protein